MCCSVLTCCVVTLQGEFVQARDNLEVALSVINRPIPSSYFGMAAGLLWSLFSHILFQVSQPVSHTHKITCFLNNNGNDVIIQYGVCVCVCVRERERERVLCVHNVCGSERIFFFPAQLLIGRGAVMLASMFVRNKTEKDSTLTSPKKPVFGVTFDNVSETYHLLHQINLACK